MPTPEPAPRVLRETPINLDVAAVRVGKCRRVIEVWISRGWRGFILDSALRDGRRYTSTEAVERFLKATAKTPGVKAVIA